MFANKLAGALGLVALALGLTACEDREVALQIEQIQAMDGVTCQPTGSVFLAGGLVDLALASNYSLTLQVSNRMIGVGDGTDGRLATRDVRLSSAIIELTALDTVSANLRESVIVPLGATVTIQSQMSLTVPVLDTEQIIRLRESAEFLFFDQNSEIRPLRAGVSLMAKIRLKGETLDGREVESNTFSFPIEICNGCLVTYPPELLPQDGQSMCVAPVVSATGSSTASAITCPELVGRNNHFVNCYQCQGYAVDDIARQLCQPFGP